MELTILIPALNEEQTIGICVKKAKKFLKHHQIEGEVLVADNASTDDTVKIAKIEGARVVLIEKRGYGIALKEGSKQAKGIYTIIGDADDSYNFLEIQPILDELKQGYDLVVGNRYQGNMEKGSMKFLHKYLGTPMISTLAKKIYHIPIGDFNCGLRGYQTQKINKLNCSADGMEYATEMIIKAKKANLKITEVPINFYKDKRNRKSHLRTIQDGFSHLKTIVKNVE